MALAVLLIPAGMFIVLLLVGLRLLRRSGSRD